MMMGGLFERLKQHPWLYGGIAAVVILVIIYLDEGQGAGSGNTATGQLDAATQASEQLQAMNNQINGQIAQTQIAADAQNQANATSLQEFTLQQQTTQNANSLAAQIAELQTTLTNQTQQNADTLQANVQEASISGQVTEYQTLANALVSEANAQASVAVAGINAANTCHGLSCYI